MLTCLCDNRLRWEWLGENWIFAKLLLFKKTKNKGLIVKSCVVGLLEPHTPPVPLTEQQELKLVGVVCSEKYKPHTAQHRFTAPPPHPHTRTHFPHIPFTCKCCIRHVQNDSEVWTPLIECMSLCCLGRRLLQLCIFCSPAPRGAVGEDEL